MIGDFTTFLAVFHSYLDEGEDDNEGLCATESRLKQLERSPPPAALKHGPLNQQQASA